MGSRSGGEQKVVGRLTPRDAANVYGESDRGPASIVDAYVFDGGSYRMAEEDVTAWVGERLGCSPILTARLQRVPGDLDYPAWVTDTDFDVRNHVTVVSGGSDWDSVRWIVAGLVHARMDLGRPAWDMTVIQGVTGIGQGMPEDATVVVLRFHHSIGDGVATSAIARRMFVADPPGSDAAGDPAGGEQAAGAGARGLGSALLRLPVGLARFGRALFVGAATARRVTRAVERGEVVVPEGRWPSTRFNQRLGGVPGIAVLYFDLATLRAVRSTVAGATVNDVMLTIIGGAMATYLAESGESPAGSLAAKMPIAMPDGSPSANKFALGSVSLHTDVVDPRDRLRLVHSSTREEKCRQAHEAVTAQRGLSQSIPAFVTRFVGSRASRAAGDPMVGSGNTLISNVPSQADGAVFGLAPIVASFGALTLADGDGIAHFVSSVGDRVSLTVTVDSAAMPDIGHYERLLWSEFEALAPLGGVVTAG